MKNTLTISFLIMLLNTNAAYAELPVYVTVNELNGWCKAYTAKKTASNASLDGKYENLCVGFVTGVTDAHQRFVNNGFMPSYWCSQGGVSVNELIKIVSTYIQANLHTLPDDAVGAVINAVREAYPCN